MATQQQPISDGAPANLYGRYGLIAAYLGSVLTLCTGFVGHSLGFIVLARKLQSSDIGHLAMISAASSLGSVWCELGVIEMARRRVGRDVNAYPDVLGHALMLIFGIGVVISIVLAIGLALIFRVEPTFRESLIVLALIVPGNVVLYLFIVFSEQMIVARGNLLRGNIINAGYGLARATAVCIACFGFGVSNLIGWAPWHFAFNLIMSIACVLGMWEYGRPRWVLLREEVPRGATMSIWRFLHILRQNVDLLALSAVASPAFIGNYSVARRVLGAASLVGEALDRVIYSRLAVVGRQGVRATTALVKRYALYLSGPLIATSVGVFLAAPLVPLVFGAKYGDAVYVVKALSVIIVACGLQNLAFDALNASERHYARLVVNIVAGCVGCALIVGGAYVYGVKGALVGVVAAEVFVAVALWATLTWLARRA
jgi:O-antigen/teichoic acid export membrane protein